MLKGDHPEVINKVIKEVLFTLIFAHDKNRVHGDLQLFNNLIVMKKPNYP